jgi:phosphonoacetaldehyde methylase
VATMKSSKKIERVFLLFPPARLCRETMKVASSPLGVGYIASSIRDLVDVEIMDALVESDHQHYMGGDFTWYGSPLLEIRKRIEKFKPDIVGITCIFSSVFPVVREICNMIKDIDPEIITITGGTYPAFLPSHCLNEKSLDMIALGEGERTMVSVINHLQNKKPLKEIDGLAFKDGEDIIINPKTSYIKDLDSLPFPARDLLPMELYKKVGIPHGLSAVSKSFSPLITSRGCPAKCIYCSSTKFWGNSYRFRSAKNVLNEIEELINKWNIEEIQFEDDNMTANKNRAKEIFRGIVDRGYKIKFNFPNGVALWTLDEELIDLMQKAGCYEMALAFESGCQEVLSNIVKKPTNLKKASAIVKNIKEKGIRTDGFYILGFPGETRVQIKETINFANTIKTDMAYFFVANPLPGTEMYQMAKDKNMLRDDFNFEDLTYTRSAYNENIFKKGELEKLTSRAFLVYSVRSFFRGPGVFLKRFFIDIFLKRPGFALGVLVRIWRRLIPDVK